MLPVVAPVLAYDDLEISDGQMAAVLHAKALASSDDNEQQSIFDDLGAYCARDTIAILELRRTLAQVANYSNR